MSNKGATTAGDISRVIREIIVVASPVTHRQNSAEAKGHVVVEANYRLIVSHSHS
jgi:hypothetical protein